jgi:hypothetical protein
MTFFYIFAIDKRLGLEFSLYLVLEMLNVDQETFHRKVKPDIIDDFSEELRKLRCRNPDIGFDETTGNIVLRCPDNKKTFVTDIPLKNYEGY